MALQGAGTQHSTEELWGVGAAIETLSWTALAKQGC
jgi:hypothetical protein